MTWRKDGRSRASVVPEPDGHYRFRHVLDGTRWENEWAPAYALNEHGRNDSDVVP